MSKVIVNGGSGFIGSHLADELVRRGYQVIILDDLSIGKKKNIENLLTSSDHIGSVRFVQDSVTKLPLLQSLFQGVDYVFHLAAIASVLGSIEGKSPIIFGNGEQTREFVFVKDAVVAAILAAESDATGIYNIGIGKTVTINELAEIVLKFTGKCLEPAHQEARSGDIIHSLANISKAKAFNYYPKYTLEEGIKEILGTLGKGYWL